MAKCKVSNVECPKCEEMISFKSWDVVDAQSNPTLKEKLLNRSLFRVKCKNCGYEAYVEYSIVYLDTEKKIKYYLVTTQQELEETLDLLEGGEDMVSNEEGYTYRIVCTQEDLLEKICLLEEGLDDRVIEVMKVLFYMNLKNQKSVEIDAIYYSKTEDGYQFQFMNQGFEEGKVQFDLSLYEQVKSKYFIYMEEDVRIDFDWATSVIIKGQNS